MMGLREKLNENESASTICAIVLVLICGSVVYWESGPGCLGPVYDNVAYYIPVTGEIKFGPRRVFPPIQIDGQEAVKAYLYNCGECDEGTNFVAYYEKYSPNAKKYLEDSNADEDTRERAIEDGILHSLDGQKWYKAGAKEVAIVENNDYPDEKCAGKARLKYCSIKR